MTGSPLLVTGATGQIGVSVLELCVARGVSAVALSRRARTDAPPRVPVRWVQQDLARPEDLPEDLEVAPGFLVHAAPLGLAAELVARLPALERAVAFSSTSILVKQDSPDPRERAVVAELIRAEEAFARACETRNVAWTLLRPTLVYGRGLDRNLTRVAAWARQRSFFPLVLGGSGLRQPVHADDLAAAALAALQEPRASARTYVLAGGTTLSYRDMVARVYASLGRTPRFVPLPAWLLAGLLRAFGSRGVPWAMAARMGRDLVFDDRRAREDLGYAPRPFEPDAGTWGPQGAESA